jgi:hypothetical protein
LQFFYKKKRLSALKRLTCCIFRLFLIFVTQKLLKMMIKQTLLVLFTILVSGFSESIFGQKLDTIKLMNPSFEDEPSYSHTPEGWFDCGFAGESPPDVHPNGAFSVTQTAFHDSTYLGMVVRDNNTWEAIGQKLKKPLRKNTKYAFSIYACQSEKYVSNSRVTEKEVNYSTPAVIKIWLGNVECEKKELVAQSDGINFKNWKKLDFTIVPKDSYRYIIIEAYYIRVFKSVYNGNILIDNASAIVPISDKN